MSTLQQELPVPVVRTAPASSDAPPPSAGKVAATDDNASADSRQGLTGLLLLSLFVVVMLWVVIAVMIRMDDQNTRRQTEVNLRNLSRAFAEHTAKTIEGADQAVRFVRSEYLAHRQTLDIPKYLSSQAIIDNDYHLLTVIGADGYVTHSSQPFSRVDLHEREHFKVHADATADKIFISKPVLGKVSNKWSLQITRRIDEPDGRFGGVVVVSMPPEYFTRFYEDVDLGSKGAIALVGMDGFVRARATQAGQVQGQDLRNSPLFKHMLAMHDGVVQLRSSIDGHDRIFAFRTLEAYKLIVVSGTGVDDAFREFRERRDLALASGAIVTLIIILFTASLYRRARGQVRLMTELRANRVKAEEANQLKSRFLASVSHELRTPLNGILGYAELVRDMSEEPQIKEFGGVIHDSARHLHSLVNTILDLAKIETGHMVTSFTNTDVRALLEETHRLHSVHAVARQLNFTLDIAPSCPPQITTDRTRLLQILGNVVNNAIKFTEQGQILLSAHGEDGHLVLTVKDNGIGIAASRLDRIFTRFQGVAAELVHSNQGAGLGLPLARELTELLGGTLNIHSEIGQGTEVRLRLPIDQPSKQGAPDDHA